jgi:hypothetical protein
MTAFLTDPRFIFINEDNREFIASFDDQMTRLGYDFGGEIGSGYCWGKYMLIYRKTNVSSKRVYARIYIREQEIVLRLFLNEIDKQRYFLEHAPKHIKDVFTGPHGDCEHCHNQKDGFCRFRKTYSLDGRLIQKCNGIVFEFPEPTTQKLGDYISLFTRFYPPGKNPRRMDQTGKISKITSYSK